MSKVTPDGLTPDQLTAEHLCKRVRVRGVMRSVEGYITEIKHVSYLLGMGAGKEPGRGHVTTEIQIGSIALGLLSTDVIEVLS